MLVSGGGMFSILQSNSGVVGKGKKRNTSLKIAFRQRWHAPRRNVKWRLAKVVETVTDKDGLVRRVKIRLGHQKMGKDGQRSGKPSIVERPVQKLILLLETV